jgi:hypothetical protein
MVVAVIVAIVDEAAIFAARVLRAADLPAMSYQVYVRFIVARCWYSFGHRSMSLLIRAFFGQQTQAAGDPKDVDVDRKQRTIAGKQQRAGCSLWADAFKAQEKPSGQVEWNDAQERQVERSTPRVNLVEQLPDPNGFLTSETTNSNCGFYS